MTVFNNKKRINLFSAIIKTMMIIIFVVVGWMFLNSIGIGNESKVTFEDGTVIENCIINEDYEGFYYNIRWEEDGIKKRRKVPVEDVISIETLIEKRP